ncbi:VOC family protein [Herpetosiphon llansteffanensis]|uniref:VOC family protein n=1 Tax=Herpetosiphon llansteffanensis TaxID=2094568 RepID=UPI00196AD952|nr:VOC family protein [Herpetosiphon llansteffanensis]
MMPLATWIDHLVVTAPNLAFGVAYIEDLLGVPMQAGGQHQAMATHNSVLKLGTNCYLEVIAPDPSLPAPNRPRWFELDSLQPTSAPRLATWVARTILIQPASELLKHQFGTVTPMSRGDLTWQITIPADGALPFAGVAPMLIQWHQGQHPIQHLTDQGCRLLKFELYHPQARRIETMLSQIGIKDQLEWHTAATPQLIATIETPSGIKQIKNQKAEVKM